jgi:hypothetical protein
MKLKLNDIPHITILISKRARDYISEIPSAGEAECYQSIMLQMGFKSSPSSLMFCNDAETHGD